MKKKILRLFLIVTTLFLFVVNVDASQEEVDNAREATEKYCDESAKLEGCIYDENDTLYTKATVKNENYYAWIKLSDVSLTRGYQAANADGKMVFAGCYKAHVNESDNWDGGDYYVFKIVEYKNGKCKETESDIVPAKGIKSYGYIVWPIIRGSTEYNGHEGIGDDAATYKSWTATNGGECPLMFGLTANTRWYTANEHRYVFSNDESGFDLMTWSFFGGEKYKTNPGCTVQDETGHDEAEECFNNAKEKINKKTCPTDLTKLSELADELQKYQDECESQYEVLYSRGLLEKDAEEFSSKLKDAAEKKISECYYGRCNITATEQAKIEAEQSKSTNSACKDGCSDSTNTTCMNCLKNVYKNAGINSTKTACMLNIEEEKEKTEDKVNDDIDNQFAADVEKTVEENKELREAIANFEFEAELPEFGFGEEGSTCASILGENLTKVVNLGITAVRIAGAIIAIVNGMITLLPPLVSKDADALKKAGNKCIKLGVVLLIIGVFPTIVKVIGRLFGYDLSCIV